MDTDHREIMNDSLERQKDFFYEELHPETKNFKFKN